MTTLTFRVAHQSPKVALRYWLRKMRFEACNGEQWGWVMEFQRRGVVHFHVLHTLAHLRESFGGVEPTFEALGKGKTARTVLRGSLEALAVNAWMCAVGDETPEFRRFQQGGIVELLRDPSNAGAYLGRYVGKLAQKTLPQDHPPMGRWWWLSPAARPEPVSALTLTNWPFKRPHHLVFDHTRISLVRDLSHLEVARV